MWINWEFRQTPRWRHLEPNTGVQIVYKKNLMVDVWAIFILNCLSVKSFADFWRVPSSLLPTCWTTESCILCLHVGLELFKSRGWSVWCNDDLYPASNWFVSLTNDLWLRDVDQYGFFTHTHSCGLPTKTEKLCGFLLWWCCMWVRRILCVTVCVSS